MGELMCTYADEGRNQLHTHDDIHYYNGVSYTVKGKVVEGANASPDTEESVVKVKIRANDIIEFKAEGQPNGRDFGEVIAILKHQNSAFLVIRWFIATGANHPKLGLPQFRKLAVFEDYRSGFFTISLVDEPKFVNGVHFVKLQNGAIVRNDWIFKAVFGSVDSGCFEELIYRP